MDHEAGEAADDGAVDADVLQVAADLEFDAVAGLVGVPTLDGRGDEVGDLGTALAGEMHDGADDPVVDLGP